MTKACVELDKSWLGIIVKILAVVVIEQDEAVCGLKKLLSLTNFVVHEF